MRVAYLVVSHKAPGQVLRLLRRLREGSPDAALIVHHDARSPDLDATALHELEAREVAPRLAVDWGTRSQLDMLLGCLRWALEHERFDWLVHLSGQDYPLRLLPAIEADLAAAEVDGFLEGVPVDPLRLSRRHVDEFVARYRYAWRRVPVPARLVAPLRPLVLARALPSGTRVGLPALNTPFGPDLRPYRGADWLTLRRRAVEAVAGRRDLESHFHRTLAPTEAFPQTVLWNRTDMRLSGDTRRYTRWRAGSPHPETLGLADLHGALASGADFARKFDDPAVLDALDSVSARLAR
jgi:hypothetical protein